MSKGQMKSEYIVQIYNSILIKINPLAHISLPLCNADGIKQIFKVVKAFR